MWVFRWFAILVLVVVFLWFGTLNLGEKVTLSMIPNGQTYTDVPLMVALLVSFVVGMFTWFVVSVLQGLKLRADLRRSRRDNDRLRDELKALRNLPMQDIEDAGDVIEAEEETA